MKLTDIKNKNLVDEAIDTDHPDAVQIPLDKAFTSGISEEEHRKALYAEFREELDELLDLYNYRANEIGGEFRGPRIVSDLDKILKNSTIQFRQRPQQ